METVRELGFPRLHNVARKGPKHVVCVARGGKMMAPYLDYAITSTEMFGSADINTYVRDTYPA